MCTLDAKYSDTSSGSEAVKSLAINIDAVISDQYAMEQVLYLYRGEALD